MFMKNWYLYGSSFKSCGGSVAHSYQNQTCVPPGYDKTTGPGGGGGYLGLVVMGV